VLKNPLDLSKEKKLKNLNRYNYKYIYWNYRLGTLTDKRMGE
jgi:hypothetical protein